MFGAPAPPGLGRAPTIDVATMTKEAAQFLARSTPDVDGAEPLARAARREARAERAATLPNLGVGLTAGTHGLTSPGYDLRGLATVTHRFLGPGDAARTSVVLGIRV